ncbi:P-type DNA transfer protein VirB5 [Massilia putida]|uniref:P-type DNA transfer protein VirB5 n=1 Tax=Massilia putida TaxID=1141883 RepID=UPI00095332F4|nr:P-type DNA transfer protein VirB5 [Massilia putida]
MKQLKILAVAAAVSTIVATPAYAQWTVNVNSDIPATMNQIQTMAQWAKQYGQMVQQITHLKNQYDAITGTRGLGQILNNPALRNYLPDSWANIYDQIKSGGLPGLSSKAAAIFAAEGFDSHATGGQKRQLDILAANKAMAMQSYDATLARVQNINLLMQKADATNDMKAAADLQNRMAAENAAIQNEQVRLNLAMQLQQVEMQMADQQRSSEFASKYFQ